MSTSNTAHDNRNESNILELLTSTRAVAAPSNVVYTISLLFANILFGVHFGHMGVETAQFAERAAARVAFVALRAVADRVHAKDVRA